MIINDNDNDNDVRTCGLDTCGSIQGQVTSFCEHSNGPMDLHVPEELCFMNRLSYKSEASVQDFRSHQH